MSNKKSENKSKIENEVEEKYKLLNLINFEKFVVKQVKKLLLIKTIVENNIKKVEMSREETKIAQVFNGKEYGNWKKRILLRLKK